MGDKEEPGLDRQQAGGSLAPTGLRRVRSRRFQGGVSRLAPSPPAETGPAEDRIGVSRAPACTAGCSVIRVCLARRGRAGHIDEVCPYRTG